MTAAGWQRAGWMKAPCCNQAGRVGKNKEKNMKTLVTGATGNVGSAVVTELVRGGAEVRALTRKQPKEDVFPKGVEVALGDLLDPVSVEQAMQGIDKLFLLNAVAADELTQALIAYGLAKRLELKHITYLSVFSVEKFRDVPHFASKLAVENALREFGVPYTILRPGYFLQNDLMLKELLLGPGLYPMPIGNAGIATVDVRDIAEAAAISLTQEGHGGKTYDVVGPTVLSGPRAAETWSKVLGKAIRYTGETFDAWEQQMRAHSPAWTAFDLRMMFQGYIERGFVPTDTQVERLKNLLGHVPRSYEDFAVETAKAWRA